LRCIEQSVCDARTAAKKAKKSQMEAVTAMSSNSQQRLKDAQALQNTLWGTPSPTPRPSLKFPESARRTAFDDECDKKIKMAQTDPTLVKYNPFDPCQSRPSPKYNGLVAATPWTYSPTAKRPSFFQLTASESSIPATALKSTAAARSEDFGFGQGSDAEDDYVYERETRVPPLPTRFLALPTEDYDDYYRFLCCLLSAICCLLSAVCCLLSAVCISESVVQLYILATFASAR
jgi:hypothetical protein